MYGRVGESAKRGFFFAFQSGLGSQPLPQSMYLARHLVKHFKPGFFMRTFRFKLFALKSALLSCTLFCIPLLLSAQLNVTVTAIRISCFGGTNGQATANPTGGAPPYSYAWSNAVTTQVIQNLAPGVYTVTVSDANQNTKGESSGLCNDRHTTLSIPMELR